jgi:UDP-glucose 4-epimerase
LVYAALAAGAKVIAVCVKDPWRLQSCIDQPRLVREQVTPSGWWTDRALTSLHPLFQRVDAVIHLYYRPPRVTHERQRLEEELRINASTAGRVARLAAAAGTRLIFTSSADVYGPWHDSPVAEEAAPRPITPYAKAKLEAERLVAESFGSRGAYACLRIATAYGPGENGPRAIPSFVRAISRGELPVVHGDGADVRDYVHVADVAAAAWNAAVMPACPSVVNIGSGIGRSTLDILRAVAKAMGVEPAARYEPASRPPSRLVLNVALARKTLRHVPAPDFDRRLRNEVRWLLDRNLAGQAVGSTASSGRSAPRAL